MGNPYARCLVWQVVMFEALDQEPCTQIHPSESYGKMKVTCKYLVMSELCKRWSKQIQPVGEEGFSACIVSPIPHRALRLQSAFSVFQRSCELFSFPWISHLHTYFMDTTHYPIPFAGPLAVTGRRQYSNRAGMSKPLANPGKLNIPYPANYQAKYGRHLGQYLAPPKGSSATSDTTKVSNLLHSRSSNNPASRSSRITKPTNSTPQTLAPPGHRLPKKHHAPHQATHKNAYKAPYSSSSSSIINIPGVAKHLQRQPASAYPRPTAKPSSSRTPSFNESASRDNTTLLRSSDITRIASKNGSGEHLAPSSQVDKNHHHSRIPSYKSFRLPGDSITFQSSTSNINSFASPSPVLPTTRIPQPIVKGHGLRPRSAIIRRLPRKSRESAAIAFNPPPADADDRALLSRVEWAFRPVTKEQLAEKISSKIKVLGRGGQGQVELWRETHSGKSIAVKVTKVRQGSNRRMLKSKKMEVEMVKRLQQDDGSWHQCMSGYDEVVYAPHRSQILQFAEYIEGHTMHRYQRLFTLDAIKAFLVQAVSGLQYMHSKGIIHRDIKSPNFMLTYDGIVKYIDFGLALPEDASRDILTSGAGTPGFLAPEVELYAMPCSTKVDIWALGICIVDFMKGEAPQSTLDTAARKPVSWWPPELKDFLARCVEKNPNGRANAVELLQHPFLRGSVNNKELLRMYKPKRVNPIRIAAKRIEEAFKEWINPK